MKYRCIALGLLALTATAQADVKVSFVNPERFSDIRDNNGFRRLEVLKDLEAFLIAEAGKQLPGRDVSFEITDVALVHRIGTLEIGDVAVAVAASAPHRRAALDACAWCIDTLKRRAPIWKKEFFEGGEAWVEGCSEPD